MSAPVGLLCQRPRYEDLVWITRIGARMADSSMIHAICPIWRLLRPGNPARIIQLVSTGYFFIFLILTRTVMVRTIELCDANGNVIFVIQLGCTCFVMGFLGATVETIKYLNLLFVNIQCAPFESGTIY